MFGRVPSTPMEIVHVREHAPANWNSSTLPNYVDAFKEAQKRIQEVHIKNAEAYNKKQRPHNFKVGKEVIFLKTLHSDKDVFHSKLGLPGEGPYRIKAINSNGSRATIQCGDNLWK